MKQIVCVIYKYERNSTLIPTTKLQLCVTKELIVKYNIKSKLKNGCILCLNVNAILKQDFIF